MKLQIHHHTCYSYAKVVSLAPHSIYLRPREDTFTRLEAFRIDVSPTGVKHWVRDACDNLHLRIFFPDPDREITIDLSMTILNAPRNPYDFLLDAHAAFFPFQYTREEYAALQPYLEPVEPDPSGSVNQWARACRTGRETETVPFLADLNRHVHEGFEYGQRKEPGVQTPGETLEKGSGTCRDFAWLLTETCRRLGLAARFTSGYLYVPGQETAEGALAESTLHAWTEVYLPGAGWKGFDPANGVACNEYYLPTASAPVPQTASPVQGTYYSHTPVRSTMGSKLSIRDIT
jgi:transglutaminase-like putative cysteine protease